MLRPLLLFMILLFTQSGHGQDLITQTPSIQLLNEGLRFDLVHQGETLSRKQVKHFFINRKSDFIEIRELQRTQITGNALMVSGTYLLGASLERVLEGEMPDLFRMGSGAAMFLSGTLCSFHCKMGLRKIVVLGSKNLNQPRSQTRDLDVQLTLLPNRARLALVF